MTVRRVHPSLIDSNNTSDGSVLIYSAANGVVEFGAASGGVDVANAWVNANDYTTYLQAQSNDYATLLEAQSNDYSTYLQAQSNDYSTLLEAQSNDYATLLQAQSNDYSTYTTLTANIYDTYTSLSANIGGSVSNDWVDNEWIVRDPTEGELNTRLLEIQQECRARLDASDYRVIKALETGEPISDSWKAYRQRLRDIFNNIDVPDIWHVVWPEQPKG